MRSEFKIYNSINNLSVCWLGDIISERGTIELNEWSTGVWWVARAIIQPISKRGNGIGSKMFDLLKEELLKEKCNTKIIVAPGGYGLDQDRQIKFYLKNGFKKNNIEEYYELLLK